MPKQQVFGASRLIITLLVFEQTDVTLLGDLAAIIGAIAVVGYFLAGRKLRQWMPLFVYILPVTVIAAIFLAVMSVMLEGTVFSLSDENISMFGWMSNSWIWYVVYLAVFPGIVGHAGISAVLRWFPPIIVSVAYLFEPLVGSFIGWIFGTTGIPSVDFSNRFVIGTRKNSVPICRWLIQAARHRWNFFRLYHPHCYLTAIGDVWYHLLSHVTTIGLLQFSSIQINEMEY